MIDIHCHILPGVDDGSHSLKSSITMLKQAAKNGITDIILTPHYIKGSEYTCTNAEKRKLLTKLKTAVTKNKIPVNLYLGNEIFLDTDLLKLIKKRQVMPLNNSKYVLIELPVRHEDVSAKGILYELVSERYIPIIAHPERYHYLQDNPAKIQEYINLGCLMQGDYLSITGRYGKNARKTLKKFLKNDQIHFLASDLHHSTDKYLLKKCEHSIKRIVKKDEKVAELFEKNPQHILKNETISATI